jgi:hypothetical protein
MTNLDDILNELPTAQKQESLGSVLDSLPVSSTFKNNTSVGSLRKIEADQEQSEKERANLVASLPGADPYYGHGVKGVPYRDPSIVDNSQNGINSIVSAAQQYKANIEKVLGELQQANKNADESRTIPYLPGADPFYAHYQKNLPYQDPNIRTPEQAAAAYQVTKEIIGKPAGNIAITPFVPAPIRGVAGAAFLPFLVNDIADTYNKNNQPNNLKRVLNGEDLPENLPSSSGVLTKTANEAVVQPVIDPIKRAVSNPNEFIRNIADDPTKLWSDVFLPYAVVGHPAKSVLEKTSNGLAKVLDELPRAKEELGKNLDANSQPSNDLYIAIVKQESNGNYEAVNKDSGARGNIQWMPETWASEAERVLGDKNAPMTPANQEVVGRAYIQRLSEELQDPKLVAAAIYAGEGYAQSLAKGKPLFDPNIRFDEKGNLDPNGKYPSVSEYINQVLSKTGDNGFSPQGLNRFSFEETPGSPFKITDVKDESETLQKKDITLDEAIKQGDYEIAATLAEEMGSKIYAERFRRMAAGQNKAAMVAPEDTKTAIDGGLRFNKDNSLLQKPDAVVSRIKGDEIPLGNTFEEARKNARDWAIENVRGAYENRDLGLIDVPSNGIRHTINSARELEHLKAVAALPDLIRNAVKVDTRADYRGRPDIRNVHTLYAPLDIGGKSYISKIVVNETKDGHKFYDHQASEIKELGGDNRGPQSNKGQLGVSPAPSSTNMSISDLLQNVKEEHKPSAIREQSNGKEFMAANGMTVPKNSMPPELPSGETVKDTISRRDIVNKVNELFTKVSTGRLGVRGVLGWFDRDSEVIRTKDYADFRAIMHEIGQP